jgi:hypothetical protein
LINPTRKGDSGVTSRRGINAVWLIETNQNFFRFFLRRTEKGEREMMWEQLSNGISIKETQ